MKGEKANEYYWNYLWCSCCSRMPYRFLCQLIKNDIENVIVFIVTRLAIAIAAGLTVAMALSI
ncbi:MAG: hypothetical protein ACLSU6_12980 [Thomasclavelia ramosa]